MWHNVMTVTVEWEWGVGQWVEWVDRQTGQTDRLPALPELLRDGHTPGLLVSSPLSSPPFLPSSSSPLILSPLILPLQNSDPLRELDLTFPPSVTGDPGD